MNQIRSEQKLLGIEWAGLTVPNFDIYSCRETPVAFPSQDSIATPSSQFFVIVAKNREFSANLSHHCRKNVAPIVAELGLCAKN